MLSKQIIKRVNALQTKKYRDREQAFVAEGPKLVGDLLSAGLRCLFLAHTSTVNLSLPQGTSLHIVSAEELERISHLKTPQGVVAVFRKPDAGAPPPPHHPTLLLDAVQDPGNVGTIIRLADWFGFRHVVLGSGCADPWGGKCLQASMGAIAHVQVYTDIDAAAYTRAARLQGWPVQGCVLTGEDIYKAPLPPRGIVVVGNEGNGISQAVLEQLTHRITIPNCPEGSITTDSLNVAIATAIVCSEMRRRQRN